MEHKRIICPCCEKEVDIALNKYSTGFNFNYSILINSEEEFFDLVDMCPECGYTMLFNNGISDEMKEYVASDEYRNILYCGDIEIGLKKWILLAILSEYDGNYTEAGIAYTKAYDYLELKKMSLDKRLIEKAASCFLSAVDKDTSFIDAYLAIDSMRRDGNMESAKRFLDITCETFSGKLVDDMEWKENIWIQINDMEKKYLDI